MLVSIRPPFNQWGVFDISNGTHQMCSARVMDIFPSRGDILTHEDIATPDEEMQLSYLLGKSTFYESFEWKDSNTVGTVLYEEVICIAPAIMASTIDVAFQPTLMEYTALPFVYWRGDLVVKLEIVGTQFHTGKLALVTRYGGAFGFQSLPAELSQYAHVIDVAGNNMEFEFVIPWRFDREMARVPQVPGYALLLDNTLGVWHIIVLNPLQFGGVASSVQVNVYLSMRNCKLDCPDHALTRIQVADPYV